MLGRSGYERPWVNPRRYCILPELHRALDRSASWCHWELLELSHVGEYARKLDSIPRALPGRQLQPRQLGEPGNLYNRKARWCACHMPKV